MPRIAEKAEKLFTSPRPRGASYPQADITELRNKIDALKSPAFREALYPISRTLAGLPPAIGPADRAGGTERFARELIPLRISPIACTTRGLF